MARLIDSCAIVQGAGLLRCGKHTVAIEIIAAGGAQPMLPQYEKALKTKTDSHHVSAQCQHAAAVAMNSDKCGKRPDRNRR